MGTLDDLADSTSQNKMFIRFSDQEDINVWNPTATNTAGTFLLDQGNEIITAVQGKDYVLGTHGSGSLCYSVCWTTFYFFITTSWI
jgi:hypothetical protein